MRLFNMVVEEMQGYCTDRDVAHLNRAIKALAAEAQEPQLQEAIISLPMTGDELQTLINSTEGYLEFPMNTLEADGPVEDKQLIRVAVKEGLFDIMAVARMDSDTDTGVIILVTNRGVGG